MNKNMQVRLGVKRLEIDFIKNLTRLYKHLKFDIVVEYELLIT